MKKKKNVMAAVMMALTFSLSTMVYGETIEQSTEIAADTATGGRTVDYYSLPANGGTWDGSHYIKRT